MLKISETHKNIKAKKTGKSDKKWIAKKTKQQWRDCFQELGRSEYYIWFIAFKNTLLYLNVFFNKSQLIPTILINNKHFVKHLSSKRQDDMTALEGRFSKHIVGIKQSCAIVLEGTTILCQHRKIVVRAQKKIIVRNIRAIRVFYFESVNRAYVCTGNAFMHTL